MSLVQPFKTGCFEKVGFQKVRYEIGFFEKVECLVNTYKSGDLGYKLPKGIAYIYIYIFIYIKESSLF